MNLPFFLLTLCQGLFMTNNVAFIAINGLVGASLAPQKWMATLPVMGYVVGSALFAPLVGRHQRLWGRKRTFQTGLLVAMAAAASCALAVFLGNFLLLIASTLLAGYYNSNASLYRFAATEIVAPAFKARAISWVLSGGIVGAVAGPNLAGLTKDILPLPFLGTYLGLVVIALLGFAAVSGIPFPPIPTHGDQARPRPLGVIARQPAFLGAIAICALGYGVMNLLMAATPLAMVQCHYHFKEAAGVLEWHVLGMFVPSFFTGSLIKRFGALAVMSTGFLSYLACLAIALSGIDLMHFSIALLLLGIGWNFLYIGGTTLFTDTYRPEEKTTAQATMDSCVYTTMALTSLGSGAFITTQGWDVLNKGALLPVLCIGLALALLAARARRLKHQSAAAVQDRGLRPEAAAEGNS